MEIRSQQSWFRTPDTRLEDYLVHLAYTRGVITAELYQDWILSRIHPKGAFVLRMTVAQGEKREATLDWLGGPGVYEVQRASPMGSAWETITDAMSATNCTVAMTNASGFFRVQRLIDRR